MTRLLSFLAAHARRTTAVSHYGRLYIFLVVALHDFSPGVGLLAAAGDGLHGPRCVRDAIRRRGENAEHAGAAIAQVRAGLRRKILSPAA